MKNCWKRNRQTVVYLIVFFSAFILVGCGVNNTKTPSFKLENASQASPSDSGTKVSSQKDSTLAIIIDSETYSGVTDEISQFIDDLRKDSGYSVELKIFQKDIKLSEVKTYLKNLYFNSSLEVAIFIGDIPTAQYFPGTVSEELIPTDSYYYDVYDKCPFSEQNQAYESRNKFCNPLVLPFVISRVKSPVEGPDGIKLISDYLKNNHAYRIGNLQYDQKALLYLQVLNDVAPENRMQTLDSSIGNFERFYAINSLPIYAKDEIIIADWEDIEANHFPNKMYLNELSKNHEYVYINAHGSPEMHLYGIDKDTIKNPSAFYVDFYSCNVGKFTQEDYAAGQYLFFGQTMFVKAPSDLFFAPIGIVESNKLFLLKQGLPILESIKSADTSFITQYFGDPTLKMRQGEKQKKSQSVISIDKNEMDFGQIKLQETSKASFTLFNPGKEGLGYYILTIPDFSFETIENSYPLQGYDKPYQITLDGVHYTLLPNQKGLININIKAIAKGNYSGKILIYNSDPNNPLIKIPFKIEVI